MALDSTHPQSGSPQTNSINAIMNNWWTRLAYRHRQAEISLHLLFISGIPLWSLFQISWPWEKTLLFAHSIIGLVFFPLFVLPFWISHRRLLSRSKKPQLRKTGQLLDIIISACGISGFYLILIGNRGDLLGLINHYVHLVTAIPLTIILIKHAFRWSVLSWLFKPFIKILKGHN